MWRAVVVWNGGEGVGCFIERFKRVEAEERVVSAGEGSLFNSMWTVVSVGVCQRVHEILGVSYIVHHCLMSIVGVLR